MSVVKYYFLKIKITISENIMLAWLEPIKYFGRKTKFYQMKIIGREAENTRVTSYFFSNFSFF